ncbi:MAG: aldo/keto reductase [Chloroflexota bacterium]
MLYRQLGRTGLRVSALGFGAMRLPMAGGQVDYDLATPLLRRAFALGVNYFDTAYIYCDGTSEVAVGKALAGLPRQQVYVSSKLVCGTAGDARQWRARLEEQLRRLDTPYLDVHHCHDLRWREFEQFVAPKGGILQQARRAQAEGLIRHLAFSCHDTPENMRRLVATGEFESLTVQYNLLDRANAGVIAEAQARGLGVVVMGPLAGGRLATPPPAARGKEARRARGARPELALRFVLANPAVSVAISGMNAPAQLEENAATAARPEPLGRAELESIEVATGQLRRLADLYCTGCGYCLPCPQGVDIPENFQLLNYYRLHELGGYARAAYARLLQSGASASACLACGECAPKCPQGLAISRRLEEVAETLG